MANKSVRKDDSEPRYKIEFMYKEYDGEYTAEECGKNVEVMLKDVEPTRLYNPHFTFYRTDAGFKASAKKSQSESESFSDMVKKQRMKNIRKDAGDDVLQERQENITAFQIMIDALLDARATIESADRKALDYLNSKITGHGGYYGGFLLNMGGEDEIDDIVEKIDNAIEYCERVQTEYKNGEWDA